MRVDASWDGAGRRQVEYVKRKDRQSRASIHRYIGSRYSPSVRPSAAIDVRFQVYEYSNISRHSG